ncbi:MAG: hypothetical protein R3A46_16705 [Thermomicrobiales bacterium]
MLLGPAGVLSAVAVGLTDRSHGIGFENRSGRQSPNAEKRWYPVGLAVSLLAFNFLAAPASLIILSFFPLLGEERGYGPVMIGVLLAIASFVTAAIQPLWGNVADNRGLRPPADRRIRSLFSLALLGLVDSWQFRLSQRSSPAHPGGAGSWYIDRRRRSRRTPGHGRVHGLVCVFAGSTGQALMPLLYGLLLGAIGVEGLLTAVGVLITIGSLGYLWLVRRRRRSNRS